MSRPVYESQSDLDNEVEVLTRLKGRGWSFIKLPKSYHMDYLAFREGKPFSFIEIKTRTFPKNQFDTSFINLDKLIKAKELSSALELGTWLFVQWTDQIGCINLNTCEYEIRLGGRTDRNDPADIGPVIHIKVDDFKELK